MLPSGYGLVILLFCFWTFKSSAAFLSLMSGRSGSDADCGLECEEEIPARPVCGSDGRTYESTCDVERAKCQGHPVEFKHKGKCPEKARCEAQRETLLQQGNGHQPGMFVPQCDSEGNYAQVQCYASTGYCWCVDHSGKPIRGSSVQHTRPNCQQTGRRSNRRRSSRGRKNKKACSSTDRASFNANLIDIFESEYNRLLHPPTTSAPIGPGTDPLTDTYEKAVIQWKFDQLDVNGDNYLKKREIRDLKRMAKKIVKPKVCAKTFAKYCDLDQDKKISKSEWSVCVGVDINNEQVNALDHILDDEPKEADSVVPSASSNLPSRPELLDKQQMPKLRHESRMTPIVDGHRTEVDIKEEDIQDCKTARRIASDSHRQDPTAGIYIPDCTLDGLYVRPQCHKSTQYCWCVHPRTGKPIRGTATQGIKPDCEASRKTAKTIKGCSLHKKQEFLDELVDTFTKEMIEDSKNRSNSGEMPTPEKAARWKFSTIDVNGNKVLDKREWKEFKREWRLHRDGGGQRQRRRLRKCWRNLPRFCDENNNQKITVDEWLVCTGITRDFKGVVPRNHRRRGPNPFSTILKSD